MKLLSGIFIILCLANTSVSAAPSWEIKPNSLPPGVSEAKAREILQKIDQQTQSEHGRIVAQQRERAQRLQRLSNKYEKRLAKAIDANPEMRALQDKLRAGAETMKSANLDDRELRSRMEKMGADAARLRSGAFAAAKLDERAVQQEILQELNAGVRARSEDAGPGDEYKAEESGFASSGYLSETIIDEPTEGVQPRAGTYSYRVTRYYSPPEIVTLGAPWPAQERAADVTTSGNRVDKEAGEYRVNTYIFGLGSGTNRIGLAHFMTVPNGISRIRISTQLPETRFFSSAAPMLLAAGAQSRTYSSIEAWDGSSRRLCRTSKLHADIWAVIVGYFRKAGDDNLVLDCEFAAPDAGRDIVIKFTSSSFGQAWGLAASSGYVDGKPDNVRVTLFK